MNHESARPVSVLIAVMGVGLVTAGLVMGVLLQVARSNTASSRNNSDVNERQQVQIAEDRRVMSEQRQLVQGLQRQVRELCGNHPDCTPLTQAPNPQTTDGFARTSARPSSRGNSARATATPRSSTTPQPRATPSSIPRPSTSPSPSAICLVKPICLQPNSVLSGK